MAIMLLLFILLLIPICAVQALQTELVPMNVTAFYSQSRLCLSMDFDLRLHIHGPTFSEPYRHNSPEIPVFFDGPIQDVIGQISCITEHLQWHDKGYFILQCYQENGTLPSFESSYLLFQNSKGLGISVLHGNGLQYNEESFFLREKRLRIYQDNDDYHMHSLFLPKSDVCLGQCGMPSFEVCPRANELGYMGDHEVISYRVGAGKFLLGSYTNHVTDDVHLSCTLPPIFLSCDQISPNGVCRRRPCILSKKHGSLPVNLLKDIALEMLAPDPIQPLSDPFIYCLTHIKPSAVKLCTAALLHVQTAFNGSSYWEERKLHDTKTYTEVKAVHLGSFSRQKTSLSFYALIEAIVFGVAVITMFLFMDTRRWTMMTWTL